MTSHARAAELLASRRGYALALVAGLLASLAVAVGSARPWADADAAPPGLPALHVSVAGTDLEPACGALGLALLAAFGAVVATRGWVRRAVGVVIVAGALVVLVLAAALPADSSAVLLRELSAKGWPGGAHTTSLVGWRWVVVVAAAVAAGAGSAVAGFGGRWLTMGSRYDAPTAPDRPAASGSGRPATAGETTEGALWQAIDEGRDPTQPG